MPLSLLVVSISGITIIATFTFESTFSFENVNKIRIVNQTIVKKEVVKYASLSSIMFSDEDYVMEKYPHIDNLD